MAPAGRETRKALPLRVLVVGDSEDDVLLLLRELRRGGYEPVCQRVDTAEALTAALSAQPWNLVLSDYGLPRFSGPAAVRLVRERAPDLPVIIVSGQIGEEPTVAAMQAGAHDYVMKGNLARLVPATERVLRKADERRTRQGAEEAEAQVSAALARAGRELIASLDRPALLDRMCHLTTEVLACEASHTLFWDPVERVYSVVAGYGDLPEHWEAIRVLKIPHAVVANLVARLERDELAQVAVTESQGLLPSGLMQEYGFSQGMYVALRRGDEIIGVHTAGRRTSTRFTPQQERIFRGIAQLASIALEHARVVEELEHANRLKYDFVATMSHELRTPLNVIIGYSDLLVEGEFGVLAREQLQILRRIDTSARQLLELINATLDLSRLEAGKLVAQRKEASLPELIAALQTEMRELQQKPGVTLTWHVAPRLPRLYTDPLKLKVVLKNVVANAVKFTDHGSVAVRVVPREGGVEIAVSDTGIGIPADTQAIIFEPFRQAESPMTRRHGGVGLGLYIARRLIDLLGGTISVESAAGQGSTFRVWLPGDRPPRAG